MGSQNGKTVFLEADRDELARTSGLSREAVTEKFQLFMKDHPDGRLTRSNFKEMMSQALPEKDASKLEKHVFRVYDTNGDGHIDFQEFMMVFHILSKGSPQEVLEKLFRVFDVNSDGTISVKEMQRLVADLYSLVKHSDPKKASKELIATTAFREMDTNQDGLVSCQEFVAAVMGQEQFSKMLTMQIMNIFSDE